MLKLQRLRRQGVLVHSNDNPEEVLAITVLETVPGGVGPMTIAMLMANTLQSFKNSLP